MWLMLQHPEPTDFVVATGTACTVREFAEHCFSAVGLSWSDHVRFDPRYLRPTEVDALIGDASKARELLGWAPRVMPGQLARIMVDAEMANIGRTRDPAAAGTRTR
jgi:GDPmannose 4,6-dehydratase